MTESAVEVELWTVRDLATRYQTSPHTIYSWRNVGRLPRGMQISRKLFWKAEDIRRFEDERQRERGSS